MVMRAQLTQRLIEAGIGQDLQREVYLCSLFSQIDALLATPWPTACAACAVRAHLPDDHQQERPMRREPGAGRGIGDA